KQYLREPDKLFRRVRDQHGQLRLSQAAKAYHPGQGVCRSVYKNARRMAATETNIAYRTADFLRWQQLDFVVGIEVRLSGNHPVSDICDNLKGKYPKDFKFTGWHPLCRCYAIPVLKTSEDSSTEPDDANTVTEPPEGFQNWLAQNRDRIERAKSLPYFLRDNSQYIKNLKLTRSAESGITEAVRQDFTVREIKPVSVPSAGFHTYKEFGNGGRIEVMDGYDRKSDYGDLISIAREFAVEGKTVLMPNPVHFKDEKYKQIYGKLIGTPYERKCPDLIIDGNFYEYESYLPPFKKQKISNMIGHGSHQSSRIIIDNNKGANDQFILRNIHNRLKNKTFKYNIDEVWLYEKGKIRLLYKK
ncbi:MAG: hypothetical protein LBG92_04960, partial [Prevotellaceae bacterium]|nr:hypothetical protein [Prevotellaceae bacterium]